MSSHVMSDTSMYICVGTWAYYDETSEEWVSVPTSIEDGYLVAETDHFSYWTVLIPESDNNFLFYIGLIGVIGFLMPAKAVSDESVREEEIPDEG